MTEIVRTNNMTRIQNTQQTDSEKPKFEVNVAKRAQQRSYNMKKDRQPMCRLYGHHLPGIQRRTNNNHVTFYN